MFLTDFQPNRGHGQGQPIRHPLPPGAGPGGHRPHRGDGSNGPGWGEPPPEARNWDRPDRPFEPRDHRDRFGGRPPHPQQQGPHGDHPMNRPYYQPPMPPHHQDRYGQGPPPPRGNLSKD